MAPSNMTKWKKMKKIDDNLEENDVDMEVMVGYQKC